MKLNDGPYHLPSEKEQLASIRPGSFAAAHGFVFIWKSGDAKTIPPGSKRNPREGMPVVICAWDNSPRVPAEIFALYHHSLN